MYVVYGQTPLIIFDYSRAQRLAEEAALSKETFFERCAHNPHLRDRLPILTRNLDMTRKVPINISQK